MSLVALLQTMQADMPRVVAERKKRDGRINHRRFPAVGAPDDGTGFEELVWMHATRDVAPDDGLVCIGPGCFRKITSSV